MEETAAPVPTTGAPRALSARDQGGPWFYRSLILNFARRDIRARFKGSLFGILWSLIVPLASLGIYTLVFGGFFDSEAPPMGNGDGDKPFAIWLFTGLVVWTMFANTTQMAMASLLGNGPLMKKIYFPPYATVLGSVLATFYQSLIEVGILVVALLAFGTVGWTWLVVLAWVALFAAFVTAVSLLLAVANVYWRDVNHVVGIALQLFFYLTPIIYTLDQVRSQVNDRAAEVIRVLPIASFVEVFRALVYELHLGAGRAWLTIAAWTLVAVVAAWGLYRRKGLDLSEEL
jgi:ABC-type polysaccharide/polyol phosphate export permease